MTRDLAFAVALDEPAIDAAPQRTLDQLERGERGVVVAIRANAAFGLLDDAVSRRLKELGFLPGSPIEVVAFGALRREPLAVRIADSTFALRKQEAAKVLVEIRTRRA